MPTALATETLFTETDHCPQNTPQIKVLNALQLSPPQGENDHPHHCHCPLQLPTATALPTATTTDTLIPDTLFTETGNC